MAALHSNGLDPDYIGGELGKAMKEAGIAFENEAYSQVLHSDDRQEGYRAFVEKRAPVFKGR